MTSVKRRHDRHRPANWDRLFDQLGWRTGRHRLRLAGLPAGDVVIRRPVQDVYRFYRNFANLPRFVGDVVAVEQVTDTTYRWVVAGPFGTRIRLTVTVTDQHVDRLIRYRTSGPPLLRGRWEVSFAADTDGGTRVQEQLVVPLAAIGRAALALIGKYPDREVTANLTRLKQLLEAGHGSATQAPAACTLSRRPVAPTDEEQGVR